jgi:hypothetical protein
MLSLRQRLRRHAASAVAVVAATSWTCLLGAGPAYANGLAHSLRNTTGHACTSLGPLRTDLGTYKDVLCTELGIYTSRTGQQSVTLQAEAFCEDAASGAVERCTTIGITGTFAHASTRGTHTGWTGKACDMYDGRCQARRTYFYPFGGVPISPPSSGVRCVYNVWGVVGGPAGEEGTSIVPPFRNEPPKGSPFLGANFATPHYNVCESSDGTITYYRVA